MKNEKTKQNEEISDEEKLRLESDMRADLMEKFVVEAAENTMLRAQSRHSIRIGNVELDVIPMDKNQSLEDVMKQFGQFAKLLKKLHGDAHLTSSAGNCKSEPTGLFQ